MQVKSFLCMNVAFLVATVAAMIIGLEWYPDAMNACFGDREKAGKESMRAKAALTFHLYMVISTLWNRATQSTKRTKNGRARGPLGVAPSWSTAFMWYQTWYYALAYLRELEAEYTCGHVGVKANGISGHSFYYMYTSVLVLASSVNSVDCRSRVARVLGNVVRCALWVLKVVQPMFSAMVVRDTLSNGYHTPKQIIVGMFFSAVVLLLLGTCASEDGRSVLRPLIYGVAGYCFGNALARRKVRAVGRADNVLYIVALTLQFAESVRSWLVARIASSSLKKRARKSKKEK